jgi:hypothetical protein
MSEDGTHLYVLVHGLSGNSYDLRVFKDYLALHFRDCEFLLCKSIEGCTLSSIEELGNNVAVEILQYMDRTELEISRIR